MSTQKQSKTTKETEKKERRLRAHQLRSNSIKDFIQKVLGVEKQLIKVFRGKELKIQQKVRQLIKYYENKVPPVYTSHIIYEYTNVQLGLLYHCHEHSFFEKNKIFEKPHAKRVEWRDFEKFQGHFCTFDLNELVY